jgi:hypothetical protein
MSSQQTSWLCSDVIHKRSLARVWRARRARTPCPPAAMDVLLQPIASLFQVLLAPTAPFTWFGLPLSTLDIVATVRLCVVMRQLRDVAYKDHAQKTMTARRARKGKDKAREAGLDAYGDTIEDDLPEAPRPVEVRSFARDAFATLLVVFGGEIMSGAYIHACMRLLLIVSSIQHHCSASRRRSCSLESASGCTRSRRHSSRCCQLSRRWAWSPSSRWRSSMACRARIFSVTLSRPLCLATGASLSRAALGRCS